MEHTTAFVHIGSTSEVTNCGVPGIEFTTVSPIVPVQDLDIALARYRRLGFDARGYEGLERYGFVDRWPVSMHLSEWPITIHSARQPACISTSATPTLCTPNGWR